MQGSKHQDSARKLDQARQSKSREGSAFEAELEAGQRSGGVPPQYTVGGGGPRPGAVVGDEYDEEEVQGQDTNMSGADVAPTERATERERQRHALERDKGRAPAGHDGQLADHRRQDVSADDLEEAARDADEHVARPKRPSR